MHVIKEKKFMKKTVYIGKFIINKKLKRYIQHKCIHVPGL